MSQVSYIVSNGTGAAVRSDLNNQLAAIVSNNSGSTEPATMYAYQWWADTTAGLLKLRNGANNAWITIRQLDGEFSTVPVENGSAAAPSVFFKDSGTDTGFFSPGADQVAISTGGTVRLTSSTTAISSALPIDHPLGAVGTPSITFTGDLNTGIYSPGGDQVAVATNGVERVEFGTSEVVFNDGGVDYDFRVEGDTKANLFLVDASDDAVLLDGNLTLKGQADLRFADSDSSHYIAIQAPSTVAANVTLTLPPADGTNGQVLSTNGSGTLSWATAGGTILYNRRPALHRGPLFSKTAATTISVAAGAVLNGQYYASATAVTMGTHTNNTDMAIWQHPTTGALVSDASYVTAPAGATGGSIVGGYHYIPSGRPTAFNNGSPTATAEILEYSIWDLTWRPVCPDPRGMTCVDGRFWCDLYFCGSTSYANTTFAAVQSSKIGLTIADNSSPALIPSFYGGNGSTAYTLTGGNNPGSWYNFAEVAHSFGKRFMFSWEFQAAAFGAPEAGSRGSDPGTVIWERASKWGLAQATGTLFTWAIERVGIYTSGSNTNTGGRGTEYADAPRALRLGGFWGVGADSGSRYAAWGNVPSDGYDYIGARFAAEHLVLG